MTYNEEKLVLAKTQLELAVAGFDTISKELFAKGGDNLAEIFEPYILAIKDLKGSVEYLCKEVKKEKAKEE